MSKSLNEILNDWIETRNANDDPQSHALALLEAAEALLDNARPNENERALWHEWLRIMGRPACIRILGTPELRRRLTDATFKIIRKSGFTLGDMFEQRVRYERDRALFRRVIDNNVVDMAYTQVERQVRAMATTFLSMVEDPPRVAIIANNSEDAACCDLACLFHDIVDTPLNIHFDETTLVHIFDRLGISIAVTDTEDRLRRLESVRAKTARPFQIATLGHTPIADESRAVCLAERCALLNEFEVARVLAPRPRLGLDQVATVMFTSGSTGEPKGVCFSIYNLVSKRFARGLALPGVGDNEMLLCYLPLYHTFGRYLELLGTIYWGGTYVFPGDTSQETVLSTMPKVNPTGFVSIPLRWAQLHERCLAAMPTGAGREERERVFREVVGDRLRWGLSAAGHLDSRVFRFFEDYGVDLCSGFGMTEATGGITMTPPGEYRDNTVGIPLPGIETRIADYDELQIRGHYVGSYLDENGVDDIVPVPGSGGEVDWLGTGDVFEITEEGYYRIVDRVKDIYKNNRGQTVAPLRMERQFLEVPGVRRTFLVGDGRPYNVLFIVPDEDSPILQSFDSAERRHEYFRELVDAANQNVAPFERAVAFEVLDRDFEVAKKEITPKGTLNRKTLEENLAVEIEALYHSNVIEFEHESFRICIPRWVYRDLGLLEEDFRLSRRGLESRSEKRVLPISATTEPDIYLVGDIEYRVKDGVINLGQFCRQPRLWAGNPSLVSFLPCKEGWDLPLGAVSPQIFRPLEPARSYEVNELSGLAADTGPDLRKVNTLTSIALFGVDEEALIACAQLEAFLPEADHRLADVVRRRLEALARHPNETLRCMAYRILLLDEPTPDYSKSFPAFISAGLSFLNEESIKEIASHKLENRRLNALRQRLFAYRLQLDWPANETTRQHFERIFDLLVSFAGNNPEYYNSVRAELACWILHKADPAVAAAAERHFQNLFEKFVRTQSSSRAPADPEWATRFVFEPDISDRQAKQIRDTLAEKAFLKRSILLAYDDRLFDVSDLPASAIWVSRIHSAPGVRSYRLSINTRKAKHFDLRLTINHDMPREVFRETIYWHAAVGNYPHGLQVVPWIGCFRPKFGALTARFREEAVVWHTIRAMSSRSVIAGPGDAAHAWRRLFTQAMSGFFQVWRNSGYRIIPGIVGPTNVLVPELDVIESVTVLSLMGWREYESPLSLVGPLYDQFYRKTYAHFPWCREAIDVRWIFDACIEALGHQHGVRFLQELQSQTEGTGLETPDGAGLRQRLSEWLRDSRTGFYLPLPMRNAVAAFQNWSRENSDAERSAIEQAVVELYHTYRLERYPAAIRYQFYRRTYFARADGAIGEAFERLFAKMHERRGVPPVQLPELSDLQAAIEADEDRVVFSRMVFPSIPARQELVVQKIGDGDHKQVILGTQITDKYGNTYTMRDPFDPAEVGQFYKLIFREQVTETPAKDARHHLLIDVQNCVVGGIRYKRLEDGLAQFDLVVIASPLKGRGLGKAIVNDFCNHMASQGACVVRTLLPPRDFFVECGFHEHRRWSGLVRFLTTESSA